MLDFPKLPHAVSRAAAVRRLAATGALALLLGAGPAGHAATSARAAPEAIEAAVPSPVQRTLRVAGVEREYLVQAPAAASAPRPVVIVLHGGTQTAARFLGQTSLSALAAREGFVLVAPQGLGRHWNDGRGSTIAGDAASTADDVGFLKALIDDVVARDRGDASAVFLFGVSNGGFMTQRFACEAGERLRAAAIGLATLPEAQARDCPSKARLPWLVVHGTDDPIVPFAGQPAGTSKRREPQPALRAAADTFRFWADRAGCDAAEARAPLTRAADDPRGRWAEEIARGGCEGGARSRFVVMHGSGHVFPGTEVRARIVERITGPDARELDGGALVWQHFRATLAR